MAWSEAARKAAALTRAAHASLKSKARDRARGTDSLNKAILVQRRSDLASKLKTLRAGGANAKALIKQQGGTPNVMLMQARISTIARNEGKVAALTKLKKK